MKMPPIAVLARISDGRTQRLISPRASNEGGQTDNDRIDVTAKALKISQEQAAKLLYRRKIPLLTVAGIGAAGASDREFD